MASQSSRRDLKLWMEMVNTTRQIQSDLREKLRSEFGWTLPKFQVMAMLANHESGMSLTKLASALLLSNANVSAMVERLVKDEMVARVTSETDRRAIVIALTTKGHTEFSTIMIEYQKWVSHYFGNLNDKEAKACFDLLDKLT